MSLDIYNKVSHDGIKVKMSKSNHSHKRPRRRVAYDMPATDLPASNAKPDKSKVYIPLAIFLLVYIGANVFVYFNRKLFTQRVTTFIQSLKKSPPSLASPPTPTPTPRPIKEIPGGKQVYEVSSGKKVVGPKIQEITIDPQTPTSKETQTVTITVKNDSPVTEAIVYIQTDNKELRHVLKLIGGTATDGTWSASWRMTDTYNYNYYFRFNLKSATGDYNDGPRLR